MQELKAYAQNVIEHGPNRVVIDAEGEAVNPRRAREQHGIAASIIFIRDDGWSLGAPASLAGVAERMWPDQWIGVLNIGDVEPMTYQDWSLAGLHD